MNICSLPDGVHSQDLESVVYYSLWYEVAGKTTIGGETYEALKQYIRLLAKVTTEISAGIILIVRYRFNIDHSSFDYKCINILFRGLMCVLG